MRLKVKLWEVKFVKIVIVINFGGFCFIIFVFKRIVCCVLVRVILLVVVWIVNKLIL